MLLANSLIAYLTLVYALHLFRKILRYFQKELLFDPYVIKTLNIIGIIFLVTSFIDSGIGFLYKLVQQKSMNLEYGLNSFIILFTLGLFFMILSEVFKIAKATEEENELTI